VDAEPSAGHTPLHTRLAAAARPPTLQLCRPYDAQWFEVDRCRFHVDGRAPQSPQCCRADLPNERVDEAVIGEVSRTVRYGDAHRLVIIVLYQTHVWPSAVNVAASGETPCRSSARKEIEIDESSSSTTKIRSPSTTDATRTTWAMRSHSMSR